MNQEKIGKFILELRKKNKLTQKEFADKLGVTFQAVSKWENGKNIPDIAVLKVICEEFSVDINDILDVKPSKSQNNNRAIYITLAIILFLGIILLIFILNNKKNDFTFKNIEANCDNFNIYGNMAYNSNKSYLAISKVEYCGNPDDKVYSKIECNLFEIDDDIERKIGDCGYKTEEPITLNDYLDNIKFNVSNVSTMCDDYSNLKIEIEATDSDEKITTYKIPLLLNSACNK